MKVQEIIEGFKEHGAFFSEPTVAADVLDEQEKQLNFQFPAAYRETVVAGSYDKATFHFLEPYRDHRDPRFVIFAFWNNLLFGFNSTEKDGDEYRIYPLGEVLEQENTYADFTAWFEMVFKMSTRPQNPG